MSTTYPVHVTAELDPCLSRWRWLFKWLLAVPHYVVLTFLWPAFVVMSIVAFFAVLVTGRYPRAVFDFNVGVLRWTWRVSYYTYGALGTDQYPPFTLEERPDYPAHLVVDYPEHLSRGLVLVKSWLLALPHYLVLGFFLTAGYVVGSGGERTAAPWLWGAGNSGLIGLLVGFAAVVLLVTGRYPRPVFDLVLGMQRWVLRVVAYAALMTDVYPPLRLDQGGAEPSAADDAGRAVVVGSDGARAGDGSSPPGREASRWGVGRVVALVLVSMVAIASFGLLGSGTVGMLVDHRLRDADGFVMGGEERLTTEGYALVTRSVELRTGAQDTVLPSDLLGDARLRAAAADGAPVFVGIAATEDVDRYLADVAHATVDDLVDGAVVREVPGTGAPVTRPADQTFWVASVAGGGARSVAWTPVDGEWTAVVMAADGSGGVDVDVAVGAELPALGWVAPAALAAGAVGLLLAVGGLVLVLRSARPRTSAGGDRDTGGGPGRRARPRSRRPPST